MVEEKNWYASRTIWGGIIAAAASVFGSFGMSLDAGNQAELTDAVVQLVGAMGAVVAIYGRLNATDVIS